MPYLLFDSFRFVPLTGELLFFVSRYHCQHKKYYCCPSKKTVLLHVFLQKINPLYTLTAYEVSYHKNNLIVKLFFDFFIEIRTFRMIAGLVFLEIINRYEGCYRYYNNAGEGTY